MRKTLISLPDQFVYHCAYCQMQWPATDYVTTKVKELWDENKQ